MLQFVPKPLVRLAGVVLLVVAFLLPQMVSSYDVNVAATILVFTVLATGLNLILGLTGLVSFGHAALFGVGAYLSARLLLDTGLPLLIVMIIATLGAGLLGALVGLTAWRVGGDYLALVTLGVGEIFYLYFNNATSVTGGATGLPGIPPGQVFGYQLLSVQHVYLFVLVVTLLITALAWLIGRSFLGRSFLAVREDEIIAQAHGINVPLTKVVSFAIGSAIAGLAGVLEVVLLGFVGPESFNLDQSILVVEIVLIGGMATTAGPLLGSILVIGSTEYLQPLADYRSMIFGALVVVILLIRPGGLVQILGIGAVRPGRANPLSVLLGGFKRSGAKVAPDLRGSQGDSDREAGAKQVTS